MNTINTHENLKFGVLALAFTGQQLPLQVLRSHTGFYIGTLNDDGSPCSRESVEYFRKEESAQYALKNGAWTQRENP